MNKTLFSNMRIFTAVFLFFLGPVSLASDKELPKKNDNIKYDPYMTSLQAEVSRWQLLLKEHPESVPIYSKLAESRYRLANYNGNVFYIDQSIKDIRSAILYASKAKYPDILVQLYLSKASMELSLHRFQKALDDIQNAQKLGATTSQYEHLLAEINWNLGDYKKSEELIRVVVKRTPSLRSLARLAILEDKLGFYKKSDAAFNKAVSLDSGISPLQSAWLQVQIGASKLERKQYSLAEKHFRQAVQKMPNYVLAIEHLAESLAKQEKIQDAIPLYLHVISLSDAPEFKVALAELYQEQNALVKAQKLLDEAELDYKELLSTLPELAYVHAGDFYLSQNNFPKAKSFFKQNLRLRPNGESYLLLAKAEQDSEDIVAAKTLLLAAIEMPPTSILLCETARELLTFTDIARLKPLCHRLLR